MKSIQMRKNAVVFLVLFTVSILIACDTAQAKIKIKINGEGEPYCLAENEKLPFLVRTTKTNGYVKVKVKGNGKFDIKNNKKKKVGATYRLRDKEELPYLGTDTIKVKAYEYLKNSSGKYVKQKKVLNRKIRVAYKVVDKDAQFQAACLPPDIYRTVTYDLKSGDNLVAFPFELFPSIYESLTAVLSENFKGINYWDQESQSWKPLLPDYPVNQPFPVDAWKCFFVQMSDAYEYTYTQSVTPDRNSEFVIELKSGENFIAIPDIEIFPAVGDLKQSIAAQAGPECTVDVLSWDRENGVWIRYDDSNALALGLGYAVVLNSDVSWKPYLNVQPTAPYVADPGLVALIEGKLLTFTGKLQALKDFIEAKGLPQMVADDLQALLSVSGLPELIMLPDLYDKYANLPYRNELEDKIWDVYYAGCVLSQYLKNPLDDLRFNKALYETDGGKAFIALIGEIWNMPSVQQVMGMYDGVKAEIIELAGYGQALADLGLISPNSVALLVEAADYLERLEDLQNDNDIDGIRELVLELKDRFNV